jgi:hypothetical protein
MDRTDATISNQVYAELADHERRYGHRASRIIMSPRTMEALSRDAINWSHHPVAPLTEFMGVPVVVDPICEDDRVYAISDSTRAPTPRWYGADQDSRPVVGRFSSSHPHQQEIDRVAEMVREPGSGAPETVVTTPNSLRTMADMLRDYMPSSWIREAVVGQSDLMDALPRGGGVWTTSTVVDFADAEARVMGTWDLAGLRPRTTVRRERHRKSKEVRNWERRMQTSLKNLAKEFAA